MNFKRLAHMRRRFMCLTAGAQHCLNMAQHNKAGGAWWETRARRYMNLADAQLSIMESEIAKPNEHTTQTRRNTPAESHQTAPTRPMAQPVADHTEAGAYRSPARLADEPRQFDDLGNIEAF